MRSFGELNVRVQDRLGRISTLSPLVTLWGFKFNSDVIFSHIQSVSGILSLVRGAGAYLSGGFTSPGVRVKVEEGVVGVEVWIRSRCRERVGMG